jgi:hypothetical protein
VKLIQHTAIGEVVPEHIEVVAEHKTIAYIYKTISCHSYNTITIDKKEVNIATIDTMLSFYLAFLYADKPYYDKTRILCMSAYLFQIEQHNRLSQKGVLKRFSTKCYGKQETLEDMRSKKNQLFKELSVNRKSPEYEKAFLKYEPKTNEKLKQDRDKKDAKTSPKPVEKTYVIDDRDEEDHDEQKDVNKETSISSKPASRDTKNTKKRFRKIRYKSYRKNTNQKSTPKSIKNVSTSEQNELEPEQKQENSNTPRTRSWMSRIRPNKEEGTPRGSFLV